MPDNGRDRYVGPAQRDGLLEAARIRMGEAVAESVDWQNRHDRLFRDKEDMGREINVLRSLLNRREAEIAVLKSRVSP